MFDKSLNREESGMEGRGGRTLAPRLQTDVWCPSSHWTREQEWVAAGLDGEGNTQQSLQVSTESSSINVKLDTNSCLTQEMKQLPLQRKGEVGGGEQVLWLLQVLDLLASHWVMMLTC